MHFAHAIRYEVLRTTGSELLGPRYHTEDRAWLLPFSPRGGQSVLLAPSQKMWLETGVALHLSKGDLARILVPMRFGRPGLLRLALEIDCRENGKEIVVLVHNEGQIDMHFNPGEFYFAVRVAQDNPCSFHPPGAVIER